MPKADWLNGFLMPRFYWLRQASLPRLRTMDRPVTDTPPSLAPPLQRPLGGEAAPMTAPPILYLVVMLLLGLIIGKFFL